MKQHALLDRGELVNVFDIFKLIHKAWDYFFFSLGRFFLFNAFDS